VSRNGIAFVQGKSRRGSGRGRYEVGRSFRFSSKIMMLKEI